MFLWAVACVAVSHCLCCCEPLRMLLWAVACVAVSRCYVAVSHSLCRSEPLLCCSVPLLMLLWAVSCVAVSRCLCCCEPLPMLLWLLPVLLRAIAYVALSCCLCCCEPLPMLLWAVAVLHQTGDDSVEAWSVPCRPLCGCGRGQEERSDCWQGQGHQGNFLPCRRPCEVSLKQLAYVCLKTMTSGNMRCNAACVVSKWSLDWRIIIIIVMSLTL